MEIQFRRLIWNCSWRGGLWGFCAGFLISLPILFFLLLVVPHSTSEAGLLGLLVNFLLFMLAGLFSGFLNGFFAGVLTLIYFSIFPRIEPYLNLDYRPVLGWACFWNTTLGCFALGYKLSGANSPTLVVWFFLACLAGCSVAWVSGRLVDWVEISGAVRKKAQAIAPEPAVNQELLKYILRNRYYYSRYEIDLTLLNAGYRPEELEMVWKSVEFPFDILPQRPDWKRPFAMLLVSVAPLLVFWLVVGLPH
jgi:hypothetical protein